METKRSTFATSFYIKRSAVRNRDGKAPIMVKISVDGDDKAVGTKLFVTPDLWENGKAKGKSAEANEINGQLKEVSARLTNHYHRILREEDFVTAEKLRNAFLGVGVMENCILKDFGNMNREFEAMVEKGQRAKSTYNKYLAVYNHFKTFLWEKKKRTDMAYKELTKEIIADFDKYLRVEKGLSANTLWIYTMPLLSLTDKAWRRGIVRTDPFGEYSLEMQETDRGYFTEEELRTLANAVFVKKQTSLVRDMFLFGCFTGLSYIDIKTLTHDKIQRMDFDGEEWIITRRTKTRVSSNVPLMEIAKELIERYRGLAGGDLVFPMPSNSVCNRHLKQIAKACGIHKEIGFHLSRHTFATTVYLCKLHFPMHTPVRLCWTFPPFALWAHVHVVLLQHTQQIRLAVERLARQRYVRDQPLRAVVLQRSRRDVQQPAHVLAREIDLAVHRRAEVRRYRVKVPHAFLQCLEVRPYLFRVPCDHFHLTRPPSFPGSWLPRTPPRPPSGSKSCG